jgi:hypothetical protein
MKVRIPLVSGVILAMVMSCASTQQSRIEAFTLSNDPVGAEWALDKVEVSVKSINNTLARQVREILPGLALKAGITMTVPDAASPLKPDAANATLADIMITEKEITKGLETLNSTLVILKIRNRSADREIAKIVYTEVSESTIESSYHLYDVLTELCGKLPRVLGVK